MSWSSVVVGDVNIERFIDEVKVRPSLWNSASDDYKDRYLKKRQWIELCILFDDQFEALTPKEKAEKCKGLQAKWKNIKDRYRKYLKSLKTKSGQARKNVTTYVFAANLSFLDGVVEMGPTQASPNVQQLPIVKPLPIHEKSKLRVDFMNIAYKYSQQQSSTCTATFRQATTPRSNYNSPLDVDISGQSSKRSYFEPTLPPHQHQELHEHVKQHRKNIITNCNQCGMRGCWRSDAKPVLRHSSVTGSPTSLNGSDGT